MFKITLLEAYIMGCQLLRIFPLEKSALGSQMHAK
jgi:hypothetical protein